VNDALHRRIFLVEDDPLVAMDLEMTLSGAGYSVVGAAATSADAILLLRRQMPDLTILDLNLGTEMVFPVFDYLDDIGGSFAILSGHSRGRVPPRYAGRPFLQKPYEAKALLRMVDEALNGSPHISRNGNRNANGSTDRVRTPAKG
jgi:DNA-binding NarL/FixJ family response regulator